MSTQTHTSSEVLFQKLGNIWYVFSEINNEMVYSALPEGVCPKSTRIELFQVIEDHMQKVAKHFSKKNAQVAA